MARLRLAFVCLAAALAATALVGCPGGSGDGTACSNGTDDDGDGLIDAADPGCTSPEDDDETHSAAPDCGDEFDNDGDGKIDYPEDPGCLSELQDDETDDCPDGGDCPECANGRDDDGDGTTDYPEEAGCADAADPKEHVFDAAACNNSPTVVELVTATATAQLPSSASNLTGSCGGAGAEVVYEVLVTRAGVLYATTDVGGTTIDTVLHLRRACTDAGTELACNDDVVGVTSAITVDVTPGVYYLIVDAKSTSVTGQFTVAVETYVPAGSPCSTNNDCAPGMVCKDPDGGSDLVCSFPSCNDGVDRDGDGDADYPDDPGCASDADDDETDTCPGAGCPACANGLDDDGDTLIDYPTDTDCAAASQPVEGCGAEQDTILLATSGTTMGTTSGASDDFEPPTSTCFADDGAGDVVVFADLPATTTLELDTEGSAFDTQLIMLPSTCSGAAITCNDGFGESYITRANQAAGVYALVVDGYDGEEGNFRLNISGTIAPGGRCDGALAAAGALTCPVDYVCGPAGTCIGGFACNDGMDNDGDTLVDFPVEPGCDTPTDNNETDSCPGAGCPACSNDLDDDTDGDIDYGDDASCVSAAGISEVCPSTEVILPFTSSPVAGDTTGHVHDVRPACGPVAHTAPDDIYQLDLPATTTLSIVQTNPVFWDSTIELRDASCAGTAVACSTGTTITRTNQPAGRYFLVVDGNDTDVGAYSLAISGTIATGGSCEVPLAQSGALACAVGFSCAGTAGARVCTPAACNDAIDADGDGRPGYPSDPGCASSSDNDESDNCPSGPGCAACSNGLDDDGDAFIDYGVDLSCAAASVSIEGCGPEADPLLEVGDRKTTSTTAGLTHNFTPVAGCTSSTAAGPDRAIALRLPVPVTSLNINTNGSTLDSVVSLFSGACATSVDCDDDDGAGTNSLIQATNLTAGLYTIVVDSYGTSGNTFTLDVTGKVAAGTACTHPLFAAGVLACDAGLTCTAGTCQ